MKFTSLLSTSSLLLCSLSILVAAYPSSAGLEARHELIARGPNTITCEVYEKKKGNTCVCIDKNASGPGCPCNPGYTNDPNVGTCIRTCGAFQTLVGNSCLCTRQNAIKKPLPDGSCGCQAGYVLSGDEGFCNPPTCDSGKTWDPKKKTCLCTDPNAEDTGFGCICKTGYTNDPNDSHCIRTCGAFQELIGNKCYCTRPNTVKTPGPNGCDCKSGYHHESDEGFCFKN